VIGCIRNAVFSWPNYGPGSKKPLENNMNSVIRDTVKTIAIICLIVGVPMGILSIGIILIDRKIASNNRQRMYGCKLAAVNGGTETYACPDGVRYTVRAGGGE
jgi:hypothetical protein